MDAVRPPRVLREYALIADGERGALVGPDGDLAWLCFPSWESGAVFAGLIGGRGGYAIAPTDRHVWGGHYEPGTLIWRNRWVTDHAVVECRDALALPTRRDRAVLLRRVEVLEGEARIGAELDLRGDYGSAPAETLEAGDGVWAARIGSVRARWTGAVGELELRAGQAHDLTLVLQEGGDAAPVDPSVAWAQTESEWRRRAPRLGGSVAPRDAAHACAVLTGLTSAAGGMVAAATTSLPERAREGRNYDYRYAWIRDQCYAGQAAARAGVDPILDTAVAFVGARLLEDGPRLRPAYTVAGGLVPPERRLDLPGYPGGTDVVGNRAGEQFQLDAFGEALLLFAAADQRGRLDDDARRAAQVAAAAIRDRYREDEAGIWELGPEDWTHSLLTCAAGLRTLGLAWAELGDTLVARAATHPSGRWQRSPTDPRVDAALLLAALRGAIDRRDPRTLRTLEAVLEELTEDGYCYRYRVDERPLGEAEGAFLLCGFLVALALAQQERHTEAARWFERTRAACGPPGLLSEEFDVDQRQLRGNLPQAFVHALLLETAATLTP